MRTSTFSLYETNAARISGIQAEMNQELLRISSGKQRLSASENPRAATESMILSERMSRLDTGLTTAERLSGKLTEMESFLSASLNTLSAIRETVISSSNGAMNENDTKIFANRLEQELETFVGFLNERTSDGIYAFAGFSNEKPFPSINAPATYSGDQGSTEIELPGGTLIQTNMPGWKLLGNADAIGAIRSHIDDLKANAHFQIDTLLSVIDEAMNGISDGIGDLGNRQGAIDDFLNVGNSVKLDLTERISSLDDTDIGKALSELTKKQTVYQASMKAFSAIQGLTLFDIL